MQYIESFVKKVVTAAPGDTLAAIARSMEQHNAGAVIITDNHHPVGVLTDRDLALELGARDTSPSTLAVRVMNSPVQLISRREGVFAATQAMLERKVRRLAVVDDDGLLMGIVTLDDLLRLLTRELSNLTRCIATEMHVKQPEEFGVQA